MVTSQHQFRLYSIDVRFEIGEGIAKCNRLYGDGCVREWKRRADASEAI